MGAGTWIDAQGYARSRNQRSGQARRLHFTRRPGQTLCTAADPSQGQVRIERDAQGREIFHWRWANGRALVFSSQGQSCLLPPSARPDSATPSPHHRRLNRPTTCAEPSASPSSAAAPSITPASPCGWANAYRQWFGGRSVRPTGAVAQRRAFKKARKVSRACTLLNSAVWPSP